MSLPAERTIGRARPMEEAHCPVTILLMCRAEQLGADPVAVDDCGAVPVWDDPGLAAVAADELAELLPDAVVTPVRCWRQVVTTAVLRRACTELSPAEVALRTYRVERRAFDSADAVRESRLTARRIARAVVGRPAQPPDGRAS